MRTKLFHTIVLCGAALGGAVGCSADDSGTQDSATGGAGHDCDPVAAGGEGGVAAGSKASSGATTGGDVATGCGGWPPTK